MEASPRPDPVDDGTHHSSAATDLPSGGTQPPADDAQVDEGAEPGADDGTGPGEMGDGKDPLRFSNWMKRSATGAVMTGIAVGLKEALQPQRKEVPFVIESRDDPDDPDKPIDLHFDPDSPEATVAIIRRPVAPSAPADPPVAP